MRIVAYVRVSTAEQGLSGLGIEAQRAAIAAEAERRGWDVAWVEDVASGRDLARPGAECALRMLRRKEAGALVVAKLDRLSRSVPYFASLLEKARKQGWALIALDLGVDTTTPAGELVANVMVSVAQWERRQIGQRTAEALAAKKAQGVRLGRPRTMPRATTQRVLELRAQGLSLAAIANTMNDENIPTQRGGRQWYGSTVQGVLDSARLDGLVA